MKINNYKMTTTTKYMSAGDQVVIEIKDTINLPEGTVEADLSPETLQHLKSVANPKYLQYNKEKCVEQLQKMENEIKQIERFNNILVKARDRWQKRMKYLKTVQSKEKQEIIDVEESTIMDILVSDSVLGVLSSIETMINKSCNNDSCDCGDENCDGNCGDSEDFDDEDTED